MRRCVGASEGGVGASEGVVGASEGGVGASEGALILNSKPYTLKHPCAG